METNNHSHATLNAIYRPEDDDNPGLIILRFGDYEVMSIVYDNGSGDMFDPNKTTPASAEASMNAAVASWLNKIFHAAIDLEVPDSWMETDLRPAYDEE